MRAAGGNGSMKQKRMDALTRMVVSLSAAMLAMLIVAAGWIVAFAMAQPRQAVTAVAAAPPAPPPTLPRSHFVPPPFADLAPAAEPVAVLTPMASAAVVEVVAASNV